MGIVAVAGLVIFIGATSIVVWLAHQGRLSSLTLGALAGACFVGLVAMVVTDWPLEVLAPFWRDHSVLSAVVSTMLLVGVGFLAFEARDAQRQAALDESVTSAGLGGLVDHVVDVEIVLALVGSPHPPSDTTWPGWQVPGRPLGWLRSDRVRLGRLDDGGPSLFDPRAGAPEQITATRWPRGGWSWSIRPSAV